MKKRIVNLCAALLALCLCAGPASALESANNHPGGPFLYPIVPQADDWSIGWSHLYSGGTALVPDPPFDGLWRSFYGAKTDVDWDRAYGDEQMWEGHKAEYPDRNTVFRYHIVTGGMDKAPKLKSGLAMMDLETVNPTAPSYAVVLNRKTDGAPVEAAFLEECLGEAQKPYWYVFPQDGFGAADTVAYLRLDEPLKKALLSSGLDLAKTEARSLTIQEYGDGILFSDGEKEFFQPQHWYEWRLYDPLGTGYHDADETPDPGYREYMRFPEEKPALELGRLYPAADVTADMLRIANGKWRASWGREGEKYPALTAKPVIYLYPQKETDVSVKLRFGGELTYTYPTYGGGWSVTAFPDGRIVNKADGSEHYYLFWEGVSGAEWTFDRGFCVEGADTEAFLREKLPLLGLTPREYNDFITYWVPRMQGNRYNLIKFADAEYERMAPLTVTPKPDVTARIHMVYKPLEAPVKIAPQKLSGFDRKGFAVVEWGGTEAKTPARTK